MPRLCSKRSCSYPGRPARQAVQLTLDSVLYGNMEEDQAGVSRGHSSSPMRNEGPNPEKGKGPASSTTAMNPTGGVEIRRVAGNPIPNRTCWNGFSPARICSRHGKTGEGQQGSTGHRQYAY
jgi:hypothetical protein